MLKQVNFVSVFKAAMLGTLAMTIVMYGLPPLIGLPPMDIMAALGSVFPLKISPYIPGVLIHFANGIVLTLIYAVFFYGWLPGPSWFKGALFSLLPWFFAITLLGPSLQLASQIFGATSSGAANPCATATANPCAAKPANPCAATNPCAAKAPAANPCAAGPSAQGGIPPQILSLMVHLIFGGVVGALYRPRA